VATGLAEDVYAVSMLNQRLQVLISRDQQRRLDAEAKRRGSSVGAVVREAIDARVRHVPEERRARAIAEIRTMTGGRFLPPDKLERLVEDERQEAFPAVGHRRKRR